MGTGGNIVGDLGQIGVHRWRVGAGQDAARRHRKCGADGAEQAGPGITGIADRPGPGAPPGPDAGERALLADPCVRHGPRTDGGTMAHPGPRFPAACPGPVPGEPRLPPRRSFLKRRLRLGVRLRVLRARPTAAGNPALPVAWPTRHSCRTTPNSAARRCCRSRRRQRTTPSRARSGPASTQAASAASWSGANRRGRCGTLRFASPARPSAL